MTTKTNCVCGNTIKRTYATRSKKARDGRGSGRVRRYIGTTHQLCRSCFGEFIRSRPSHDDPTEPGTHTLCDFCNNTTKNSLLQIFLKPTIFRWQGKVNRSKGNPQTVCPDCRNALQDFIQTKIKENKN